MTNIFAEGAGMEALRGRQVSGSLARSGRPFMIWMLAIAVIFTMPAIVVLNMQRAALNSTLAVAAQERAGMQAVESATTLLVSLPRYRAAIERGDRVPGERANVGRLVRGLQELVLGGRAQSRRDALVSAWIALPPAPSSAQLATLGSATIALAGAIADSAGLSFDGDVTIVNFSAAANFGWPRIVADLNCVASTTARATRAGIILMPDRLEAAACLSRAGTEIRNLTNSDRELARGDASLAAELQHRLAPERQLLAALQKTAYDRLLIPDRPRLGAGAAIALAEGLLRSHESIVAALRAAVEWRLDSRERRTRSELHLLDYGYVAAVLLGLGLIMLLARIVVLRDRNELHRAEHRYRESQTELARAGAERALELSEAQFRAVFDGAPVGIAVTDSTGLVVQTNKALDELLGAEQFLLGDSDSALRELLSDCRTVRLERQYTRRNGQKVWGELTLSAIRDGDDRLQFAIGMLQDMTDRKQSEMRLEHEANHDAMTGLANRAYFMRMLEQFHRDVRERRHDDYTLLYIDADKFKAINDALGHEAGDHVLRTIAERLRAGTRAEDIVARIGGDEFVVLLVGVATLQDAQRFVEAMHERMAVPIVYGECEVRISVSIGFAAAADRETSFDHVLREADAAMYVAKRRRNARQAETCGALEVKRLR